MKAYLVDCESDRELENYLTKLEQSGHRIVSVAPAATRYDALSSGLHITTRWMLVYEKLEMRSEEEEG